MEYNICATLNFLCLATIIGEDMIISPKNEYINLKPGSEKRVLLKCDTCGNENTTTYQNYYSAQKKRNFSGETYCRACSCKSTATKSKGRIPHNKGKKYPNLQGVNSKSWKGGSYISSDGYIMKHIGFNSKRKSGWEDYRKEHILVMEQYLGRELNSNEIIHHINGIKTDNRIENLSLLQSSQEHKESHNSLQNEAYKLVQSGLIKYNTKTKLYYIDNL